jgi:hypothetical protein
VSYRFLGDDAASSCDATDTTVALVAEEAAAVPPPPVGRPTLTKAQATTLAQRPGAQRPPSGPLTYAPQDAQVDAGSALAVGGAVALGLVLLVALSGGGTS